MIVTVAPAVAPRIAKIIAESIFRVKLLWFLTIQNYSKRV